MTTPSPTVPVRQTYTHRGLELAYLDSDPAATDRPVVLLLHGFPDQAAMWEAQFAPLVAEGFRVIAPDTVGCGHSEMAPSAKDYRFEEITGDFVALLDQLGIDRVDVVGHDWGAILAWLLAAYHPDRVRRLVVTSVGHPMAYARAPLSQKLRAWYILVFLVPGVAEYFVRRPGRLSLEGLCRAHPGIGEVRRRLTEPGRATAALRIYRANFAAVLARPHPKVTAPTLGIWSDGDIYLVEAQVKRSDRFVEAPWRYERVPGSHWFALDKPDQLTSLILDHLRDQRTC